MSLAEIYTGQSNEEHNFYGKVITRPSFLTPKTNIPTNQEAEALIRAERVVIYSARLELNQDIWTGTPLPPFVKTTK